MVSSSKTESEQKKEKLPNLRSGSPDLIEAGDLGRSMGKDYLKQLENMRSSHSRLKGKYYILVNHYQQAYNPTAQYLCFCSMRERPDPMLGCDLWEINNDNDHCDLKWSLPHRESWNQIKRNIHTDLKLREFMDLYDEGKL